MAVGLRDAREVVRDGALADPVVAQEAAREDGGRHLRKRNGLEQLGCPIDRSQSGHPLPCCPLTCQRGYCMPPYLVKTTSCTNKFVLSRFSPPNTDKALGAAEKKGEDKKQSTLEYLVKTSLELRDDADVLRDHVQERQAQCRVLLLACIGPQRWSAPELCFLGSEV